MTVIPGMPEISQRVSALHARMTLEEKLAQLVGFWVDQGGAVVAPMQGEMASSGRLEEAAAIDGASRLGFFFRMVIPLSVPGVVTVGILAFIASWNSYMLPLFILNNEGSYTLPLGVQAFASQYSVDTARVLAFTSLSMIPALVFFSVFEHRIISGLSGAVKG